MTREEKKSRIRGLPPKLVLQTKDAHTGSLPSKIRIASDNRTGKYNINFDDTNVLVFTSSTDTNYLIGGLNLREEYVKKPIFREILGKDLYGPDFEQFSFDTDYLSGNLLYSASGPTFSRAAFDYETILNPLFVHSATLRLVPTVDYGSHRATGESPVSSGSTYTFGAFVNFENGYDGVRIRYNSLYFSGADYPYVEFQLQTDGTILPTTAQYVSDYGTLSWGGGWQFIYMTANCTNDGDASYDFYALLTGSVSFDGDGSHGIYIWNQFFIENMDVSLLSGSQWTNSDKIWNLIYSSGKTVKGVSDQFLLNTPGQPFEPFRDDTHPAVDALSITSSLDTSFWTTGSAVENVGEGFSGPLWSKTKIEIDLTPSRKCGIQRIDGGPSGSLYADNFVMAYWNKDEKIWEGVGPGYRFATHYIAPHATSSFDLFYKNTTLIPFLKETPWGFGSSIRGTTTETPQWYNYYSRGTPIQNFGFPSGQQFHATSSNLISLSDYIDGPFLFEKAVLIFSASFTMGSGFYDCAPIYGKTGTEDIWTTLTTFFILNQRKNFSYEFETDQGIVAYSQSAGGYSLVSTPNKMPSGSFINSDTGQPVNTGRDLITFMQISTFDSYMTSSAFTANAPFPLDFWKEYNISTNHNWTYAHNWNLYTQISASTKSPNRIRSDYIELFNHEISGSGVYLQIQQESFQPTRTGTPQASGRSLLNELRDPNIVYDLSIGYFDYNLLEEQTFENPYILLPEDNLIFGWQLPLEDRIGSWDWAYSYAPKYYVPFLSGSAATIEFDTVPQKIIIYGSQIKEGKEYHDTLNQLLTADNIHEEIE